MDSIRKLASIQKIVSINPIPNADKIQVARVLDWECVIKKDEFKVGDFCVYIEIDSIVPEAPWSEFLRERKFRIKTIKLRSQISQGLVLPLSVLPQGTKISEGDDVTEILGVKKYDPQLQEESELDNPQSQSALHKFLMKNKLYRKVYLSFNTKVKGSWPQWIIKTDENRIQTCASILMKNIDQEWYISEKLDGQSGTFFTYNTRKFLFNQKKFGVCSRNIWLKTPSNNNYWTIAKKYNLENKLLKYKEDIIVQGEILAPKVQGNKYKVIEPELYVFNVYKNGIILNLEEMVKFCRENELNTVPILESNINFSKRWDNIKETHEFVNKLIEYSTGTSQKYNTLREGIVVRLINNPKVSFKVISPKFLLDNNE